MRRFLVALTASMGIFAAPLTARAADSSTDTEICEGCEALLDLALANPRRNEDRQRDIWRHPAETIAFFKVRPGMTVVDYMPAGGWYTRVLVPYLGRDGSYIGLNPAITPAMSEGQAKYLGDLRGKFAKVVAASKLEGAPTQAFNGQDLPEAMNGTVDRVLIFREMHNLHRNGLLHAELDRLHDMLKDNGMLGVVQHRARADAPAAYTDGNKGYMRQKDVIGLIEAHGFELVGSSEVNANPKDTADYPGGVWTLPPTFSGDEATRARYEAIGESDRMTLLFRKRS